MESMGKREQKKKRKYMRKRESGGEYIVIFCLVCHKLFKGYVLPTTHLGM